MCDEINDNPNDPANDMRIAFDNDIARCMGSGTDRCMCYRQVCPKYPICDSKVPECKCTADTFKSYRIIDNTIDYVHANLYLVLVFVTVVVVAAILLSRKK